MFSPDMTLERFTAWWLQDRPFLPPFNGASYPSSDTSGIVLYRNGPFQVQLFIFKPNAVVTSHRHPNVDSYEHYMCGEVFFYKNGKLALPIEDFVEGENGVGLPFYKYKNKPVMIRILPTDVHKAQIGPNGGSFLSIQKWLDGKPRLIELDWVGKPLDETHNNNLHNLNR